MKKKTLTWIYPALLLTVLGTDQLIKRRVERQMQEGETHRYAGGRLLLRSSRNRGVAMNVGEKRPEFVCGLSVGLTAAMTFLYIAALGRAGKGLLNTGLSLLLGGAYSNTYDRLVKRQVTDYVSFDIGVPALKKIVFNLGDFGVIAGAGLIAAAGMKE